MYKYVYGNSDLKTILLNVEKEAIMSNKLDEAFCEKVYNKLKDKNQMSLDSLENYQLAKKFFSEDKLDEEIKSYFEEYKRL